MEIQAGEPVSIVSYNHLKKARVQHTGGGIMPGGPGRRGMTMIPSGPNHMGKMIGKSLLSDVVVAENDPETPLIVERVSMEVGPV